MARTDIPAHTNASLPLLLRLQSPAQGPRAPPAPLTSPELLCRVVINFSAVLQKSLRHEATEGKGGGNHHQSCQAHSCSPSSFRKQQSARCHKSTGSGFQFYIENTHICTWVC